MLEQWNMIDTGVCLNQVHSMPRRLAYVVENRDGHTKYKQILKGVLIFGTATFHILLYYK